MTHTGSRTPPSEAEIEGLYGLGGKPVKCEECERHLATLNVDLGETWGTICLCGLCALELVLRAPTSGVA